MKKLLIILSVLLCSFLICSCTFQELDSSDQDVVMLDFDVDKGITGFSSSNPFTQMRGGMSGASIQDYFGTGGFWMAAGAMQNLPIIPYLKTAKLDKVNDEFSKNKVLDAYGFPMVVDSDVSKADSNSIFVRYYLYDYNDTAMQNGRVGQIDYYYDIKNGTFSYREILTPFFGEGGGDNIFVFELIDVPVNVDKNGNANSNGVETISFNVNQAGKFQLIDFYFLPGESPDYINYSKASVMKYDVLMSFSETINNANKAKECTVFSTVFNKASKQINWQEPVTLSYDNSLAFALEVLPEKICKPFTTASFSEKIDSETSLEVKNEGIYDIFAYSISSKDDPKGAMIYSGLGSSRISSSSRFTEVDAGLKISNGTHEEFVELFGYPSTSFEDFMSYHLANCGIANPAPWLSGHGY